MEKKPFYITTSIAYTNAAPHIGYALELLIADAIARYKRLQGYEVRYLTGTDEHGIKIYHVAQEAGLSPQEFVDKVSAEFKELAAALNLSNTDFIRTTDRTRHWPAAQRVWQDLAAKGDIYLGHYKGLYCVNDEAYITKTEFESGAYANKQVIELEEDNYMFKLSAHTNTLKQAIGRDLEIIPSHRGKEILNFIDKELADVSFSRQTDKLPWGIPVPGTEEHVMYVWSDALTNYISALGYPDTSGDFAKFWPADVQVIGKDILRFHAVIWPAMLSSLGLALPKKLLVHGFITSEGQKMSKSIGNVVSTTDLLGKYGTDATRYYLLHEIPTFDDGDYSAARMQEAYANDLANKLGNLLSRVHKLVSDNGFAVADPTPEVKDLYESSCAKYVEDMEALNLSAALETLMHYIRSLNEYISERQPWAVAKTDPESARITLGYLLEGLRRISIMLYPFLPETADKIRSQLGFGKINPSETNLAEEMNWGQLPEDLTLGESAILFPRID